MTKSVKVSRKFVKALGILKADRGYKNNTEIDAYLGVGETSVSGWIAGRTKTMRPATWIKIKPKIQRYIDMVDVVKPVKDDGQALLEFNNSKLEITDKTPWKAIVDTRNHILDMQDATICIISGIDKMNPEKATESLAQLQESYKQLEKALK